MRFTLQIHRSILYALCLISSVTQVASQPSIASTAQLLSAMWRKAPSTLVITWFPAVSRCRLASRHADVPGVLPHPAADRRAGAGRPPPPAGDVDPGPRAVLPAGLPRHADPAARIRSLQCRRPELGHARRGGGAGLSIQSITLILQVGALRALFWHMHAIVDCCFD
jgi:hypothetical protein